MKKYISIFTLLLTLSFSVQAHKFYITGVANLSDTMIFLHPDSFQDSQEPVTINPKTTIKLKSVSFTQIDLDYSTFDQENSPDQTIQVMKNSHSDKNIPDSLSINIMELDEKEYPLNLGNSFKLDPHVDQHYVFLTITNDDIFVAYDTRYYCNASHSIKKLLEGQFEKTICPK